MLRKERALRSSALLAPSALQGPASIGWCDLSRDGTPQRWVLHFVCCSLPTTVVRYPPNCSLSHAVAHTTQRNTEPRAGYYSPDPLHGADAMLRTIEQSVRDFTKRLLHLKNIQGQTSMPVVEALQWAREMQEALDAVKRGQNASGGSEGSVEPDSTG